MKVNAASLMTGAIGLLAKEENLQKLLKSIPVNPMTMKRSLQRELGDIMWYWITSCRSLGLDPNEVIAENVNKLQSRYPDGEFDVFYSENRKEGDL